MKVGGSFANTLEMIVVARLSEQIRKLRTEKEWTQRRLAQEIGISETAVMRLENKRHGPRTLNTLCRVLYALDYAPVMRIIPIGDTANWPEITSMQLSPLRQRRRAMNLTQAQVAEHAGVHVTTVQRAERGLAMPETVRQIETALSDLRSLMSAASSSSPAAPSPPS